MDINAIINAILTYGSVALLAMYVLTTAVQLTVEVAKRLLPKVPTDIVVFVIAIVFTLLALYICAAVMEITVMWYYAVGAVILGIFVAYAAMFGWDKFHEIWNRIKEMLNK